MLISNKVFLIVLYVILLFYSLIIFLSYRFNKIQKEKEKEKEIKYATKYGKLLAEENPKDFFTY